MKTAHRIASRAKRDPNHFPKYWRPKAQAAITHLKIAHWDNLGNMKGGQATREEFWDWLESGYTATFYVNLLREEGVAVTDEACEVLAQQLQAHEAIIARFVRTGRATLDEAETILAETATEVMEGLLEFDRNGALHRAAMRSDELIQRMKAKVWI